MTDKVWTWVELLKQIEAHARECDADYIEKQKAYETAKMEQLKANEALDEFVQLMAKRLDIPSRQPNLRDLQRNMCTTIRCAKGTITT